MLLALLRPKIQYCTIMFKFSLLGETSEEVCKQEISSLLMHVISDKVFKDIISMHGIGT